MIKQRLIHYIKNYSPLIIIKTYQQIYQILTKIKSYWLPVYVYSGTARKGSNTLKFAYLGWNQQISYYWRDRIFERHERIPYKKLVPFYSINKYLKNNTMKCDLAIVELINKRIKQNVSEDSGFLLPRWLKMYMEVDPSLSIIKKQKDILKRIKKHALSVEKSYSEKDFTFFYEKMYKPYVKSRHKASAFVENLKNMLRDFKRKNSTIYFITQDGIRIAGLYEQNETGIPYLYAVGVIDGSCEIMKMGVIGALYYFVLSDHKNENIKQVAIGGTSTLLTDGLTRFKMSLGAKVSGIQHQDSLLLKLILLRNTQATRDFLTSNPFIFFENNSIYRAVFADESKEEDYMKFHKICSIFSVAGIEKTRMFLFNSHNKLSESALDNIPGDEIRA